MKRFGSLLVFKAGLDPAIARAALKGLEELLDPDYFVPVGKSLPARNPDRSPVISADGTKVLANIEPFDDEYGGPTFYVP
jgi:hypothetical protein